MPIDKMIGTVSAGPVLILKTSISPAKMRIPRAAGGSNIMPLKPAAGRQPGS